MILLITICLKWLMCLRNSSVNFSLKAMLAPKTTCNFRFSRCLSECFFLKIINENPGNIVPGFFMLFSLDYSGSLS